MLKIISTIFRSPQFLLLVFGVLLGLLWHFSIAYASPFSWLENRHQVERLFLYYLALHGLLILLASVWAGKMPGGRWFLGLLAVAYCIYLTVRITDWAVLYYYGDHVDAIFWDNAFYSAGAGMILTQVVLLLAVASLAGLAILCYLFWLVVRHRKASAIAGVSLFKYLALYCVVPLVAVLVLGNALISNFFLAEGRSAVYTRYPPEYHFITSIADFLGQGYAEKVVLSTAQKSKLASMGIPQETLSPEYPLLKESIYLAQPDAVAPYKEQPNVILVLAESYSSYFLEEPSIRALGITPNLDAFGAEALSFTNIVNANTPTLQGQVATLASSLHVFKTTMNMSKRGGHVDVDEQDVATDGSVTTRYPFMSRLLKEHGYDSVHFQGGDARFADTEHYFRFSAQYDDFISVADSSFAKQRQYEVGTWGAADIDTFSAATDWLESRQGGPFLLTISTMDVHHPYKPVVTKSGVDDNLLNTVYATDAGFGVLWDFLKTSQYKDNTIVIFTADHPLFPTTEYLNVRGGEVGYYDKIPLLIYSPFHKNRMGTTDAVLGSQLDVAPTVFELLRVDSVNAFMGLSLLSERKEYPYLFGKVNLKTRLQADADLSWSDAEQTELINYIRYLASRNKLYPSSDWHSD